MFGKTAGTAANGATFFKEKVGEASLARLESRLVAVDGGDVIFQFGALGDVPLVGDWNADGTDSIGVYRGSNARWFFDVNGNYEWDGVSGGDDMRWFGAVGDTPVVGDWNGDNVDDIGVHRGNRWILRIVHGSGACTWGGPGGNAVFASTAGGDTHVAGIVNDGERACGLGVDPFVEAVLGAAASAAATEMNTSHQTVSVAVDEPQGTAAPLLIPPAADRPLRSRRTHNSRVHDNDIRFADHRNVEQILARRSPIRTRVDSDERGLRRKDVFRAVQPEGLDDWHAAVDDALEDDANWVG